MTDQPQTKEYKFGSLPNVPVVIHAQYIKDLSFENPHAPDSLRTGNTEKPALNVNILLDAKKIEDAQLSALYEVTVSVKAESKRGQRTDYIVEMAYGAAVSLKDVPEDQHHPLLFIEVPRQLFPFIRHGVAQLTQGGGYVPLLLNPVDFMAMYVSRFGAKENDVAGHA